MTFRTAVLFILLPCFPTGAVRSESLGPPVPGRWGAHPILLEGEPIAFVTFQFEAERKEREAVAPPPGLLEAASAPGDSYLAYSRPVSPPDRDDGFSVRWLGAWRPGPMDCEFRLRSDERATFYLNGSPLLVSDGAVAGVSVTTRLDPRTHDLRLDYSEETGEAFVFLEWREPGLAWRPLEAPDSDGGQASPGWRATYFLGSEFDTPAFERIDRNVFFDWGNRGPFDRPEDLPSLEVRWSNLEGMFLGEATSNRDGVLSTIFRPAEPADPSRAKLEVAGTSLRFPSPAEEAALRLTFDREIVEDGDRAVRFELQAGSPIRFWSGAPEGPTGVAIGVRLDEAEKEFHATRPRLTEDGAPYDESLFVQGRGLLECFLGSVANRDSIPDPRSDSRDDPGFVRRIRALEGDLAPALRSFVETCCPDLLEQASDPLDRLSPERLSAAFVDSSTPELDRLAAAVTDLARRGVAASPRGVPRLYSESGSRAGLDRPSNRFREGSDNRWRILGVAGALADALEGLAVLQDFFLLDPEGGVDIGNRHMTAGTFGFESAPVGRKRFGFQSSASGLRLDSEDGLRLSFNRPTLLSGFEPRGKTVWKASVRSVAPVNLRVGPTNRVEGVFWGGKPLLLIDRGESRESGGLDPVEAEIRVRWKEAGEKPGGRGAIPLR